MTVAVSKTFTDHRSGTPLLSARKQLDIVTGAREVQRPTVAPPESRRDPADP